MAETLFTSVYKDNDGDEYIVLKREAWGHSEEEARTIEFSGPMQALFDHFKEILRWRFDRVTSVEFDDEGKVNKEFSYFTLPDPMSNLLGLVLIGGPLFAHWQELDAKKQAGIKIEEEDTFPPNTTEEEKAELRKARAEDEAVVEAIVTMFKAAIDAVQKLPKDQAMMVMQRIGAKQVPEIQSTRNFGIFDVSDDDAPKEPSGATIGCDCPVCERIREEAKADVPHKRTPIH